MSILCTSWNRCRGRLRFLTPKKFVLKFHFPVGKRVSFPLQSLPGRDAISATLLKHQVPCHRSLPAKGCWCICSFLLLRAGTKIPVWASLLLDNSPPRRPSWEQAPSRRGQSSAACVLALYGLCWKHRAPQCFPLAVRAGAAPLARRQGSLPAGESYLQSCRQLTTAAGWTVSPLILQRGRDLLSSECLVLFERFDLTTFTQKNNCFLGAPTSDCVSITEQRFIRFHIL